jgi:spore coat protein U-like protein
MDWRQRPSRHDVSRVAMGVKLEAEMVTPIDRPAWGRAPRMSKRLLACFAGLAGLLLASPASAQTATTTFLVSITVQNSCTVAVNALTFTTATDLTPAIDGATTGTVTCTGIAPVSISFDAGTGGGTLPGPRQMASTAPVATIDYNLYRDAAHTEVLGDGSPGTVTIDLTSTGGADAFDVFGQTVAGQNPKPPSTYTSTITATVTY